MKNEKKIKSNGYEVDVDSKMMFLRNVIAKNIITAVISVPIVYTFNLGLIVLAACFIVPSIVEFMVHIYKKL